ncbi:hypothetical protein J7T55_000346 [Diaporthe amygdali]|uniref:uncharacterized protein n=1 Tax=Phomopsis amygdali TaxID=1214568 RepID=UPI0022FE243C|nr:uncharacterized protein J7T55_000346 [Diaporthe amygdali]KAJ0109421.1 hypothetical protein J7T55_000346 [Diaporthe amygdali]
MLRRDFLPLLTLLAGITGGNSAAQPIRVLYPDTDGLAFYAKDVINVPYETNFTEPYLYTWCVQGNASQAQEPTRPPGGNGTAQVVLDFTDTKVNLRNLFYDHTRDDPSNIIVNLSHYIDYKLPSNFLICTVRSFYRRSGRHRRGSRYCWYRTCDDSWSIGDAMAEEETRSDWISVRQDGTRRRADPSDCSGVGRSRDASAQ